MPFNMRGLRKAPHVLLAASNNPSHNEGPAHECVTMHRIERNGTNKTNDSAYANSVDIDLWDCKPTTDAGMKALFSNLHLDMAGSLEEKKEGDRMAHFDGSTSAIGHLQLQNSPHPPPTPPPPPPLPLSLDARDAPCPEKSSLAAAPISGSSKATYPVTSLTPAPVASSEAAMPPPSPAALAVRIGTADDLKDALQAEIAKRKVRPPPARAASAEASPSSNPATKKNTLQPQAPAAAAAFPRDITLAPVGAADDLRDALQAEIGKRKVGPPPAFSAPPAAAAGAHKPSSSKAQLPKAVECASEVTLAPVAAGAADDLKNALQAEISKRKGGVHTPAADKHPARSKPAVSNNVSPLKKSHQYPDPSMTKQVPPQDPADALKSALQDEISKRKARISPAGSESSPIAMH